MVKSQPIHEILLYFFSGESCDRSSGFWLGTKITSKSFQQNSKKSLDKKLLPKKSLPNLQALYTVNFQKGFYFIHRAMWPGYMGTTRIPPKNSNQIGPHKTILAKIKSGNWNPGIKNYFKPKKSFDYPSHLKSRIPPPPPWNIDYTPIHCSYFSQLHVLFAHPCRLQKLLTALHMAYRPHFQSQLLSTLLSFHQLVGVFLVNCQLFLSTKGYFHLSPWKTVELSECKELTAQ